MTTTAVAAPLLASFVEAERHGRLYTGGKVQVGAPVASGGDAEQGAFLVCPCGPELNIIDLVSAQVIFTVPADEDEFTAFTLHPTDRRELVTAGRSRQLRSWSLDFVAKSCECIRVWKAHRMPVLDLAYDSTGKLAASASADTTAMVFDVAKGFCTHVFRGHEGTVHLIKFHPDSAKLHLLTAAGDNTLRVWDLRSRGCLATLRSHVGLPTAVAFSPDGSMALSAGRDQLVNVWSWGDFSAVSSIAVLESIEGLVVLEGAVGAKRGKAKGRAPVAIEEAANEGLRFVTVGESGLLRCWDAKSGQLVRKQPGGAQKLARPGLTMLVRCEGALLATSADHNLLFFDEHSLQPGRCIAGNNDEITDIRCIRSNVSPPLEESEPLQLAVATNSEQIKIFEPSTMACRLLYGHSDVVLALDVSADAQFVASACKDCTARVWRLSDASCLAVCDGHIEAVGAVTFAHRSAMLLTASKDKTAKLWDLSCLTTAAPGAVLQRPRARSTVLAHSKEINAVSMAPNDRLAVTGSQDRTIKVWAVRDGALSESATLKGHKRAVWCVCVSPVDKAVASGSGDMTIKVWSMADYSCLRTLEGHTSSVLRILWVSRGLQLVSSGSDGLVKLWSAKASECVCTLDAHEDKVWALDVDEAADGHVDVWSGSADSVMVRWRDATQQEQHEQSAAQELKLQQEQELSIAVHAREFDSALRLALKLRQPRALRTVLEQLLATEEGEGQLRSSFELMDEEEIAHCLQCARDWNTTAQHSLTAQRFVHNLLKARPMARLVAMPQIKSLLEALIPYTERHFERLDRLLQSSHFLGFTLAEMRVLEGNVVAEAPTLAEVGAETQPVVKRHRRG